MPQSKQVNGHSFTMHHCLGFTAVAECRGDITPLMHAVAACPASVRNLFSRLDWPRGKSIPGGWMLGSLNNELFGTSTVWCCHFVYQRYWMARISSGRLDHNRTSRFQSLLGVKFNTGCIGEQREFRLASCPENHFRCS